MMRDDFLILPLRDEHEVEARVPQHGSVGSK